MTLPRIQILALGGTIATAPDASGAMQMGLGADDLVAAVPLLATLADIRSETVSRVGSHSLSFDQIHALAQKIMGLDVDGVIVTQGTDTLEETSFLLDLLVGARHPGDRDGGDAQSCAHLARRARQPARCRACRLRSLGEGACEVAGRDCCDAR